MRIEAGALGENIPTRNLFVTDSHAVFLDGILIPIGSLVNGKNICFDEGAGRDALEYFHLEFDAHDIIDAEGAFCESRLGEGMEPCVPVVPGGGRSQLYSHLRSAIAPFVDLRQPHDLVRDRLEVRAGL